MSEADDRGLDGCPSPECPMCSGEVCALCGWGGP